MPAPQVRLTDAIKDYEPSTEVWRFLLTVGRPLTLRMVDRLEAQSTANGSVGFFKRRQISLVFLDCDGLKTARANGVNAALPVVPVGKGLLRRCAHILGGS
jgi:hypothetical protein